MRRAHTPHARRRALHAALFASAIAAPASAQSGGDLDLSWSTIDGGGGASAAGGLTLMCTIGQPDAGFMSGGTLTLGGGFWYAATGATCYPNCDGSTTPPVLNVNDFICFQGAFASANTVLADCDRNSTLNVNDFICFQAAFAAGCP